MRGVLLLFIYCFVRRGERERGEGKYVSVYNIPHLESTLLVLGTDKHASKGRYLNDVRTEGEGGLAKRR